MSWINQECIVFRRLSGHRGGTSKVFDITLCIRVLELLTQFFYDITEDAKK